ncbi:hypothetical protein N658DRAFT_516695 [Parathielavia hyrcaniae]|uniref:DNA (cytosine-5-)-methyltransferase n=1 Tax=Parathielavia hyrcaniae TaxID=113614 RepID=A0AAN6PZ02_9PEZI|nr:hypothetical protein N658DRAFT_516695 [Parathielavia hyrcaniae]
MQQVPEGVFEPVRPREGLDHDLDEFSKVVEFRQQKLWKRRRNEQLSERFDQIELPRLDIPTDPALLKALPTGFHDMTDAEQQEEIWIVLEEARLAREEWKPQKNEKHVAYVNDYPPYSPSKVLGMLHRWRTRDWTPSQWQLARAISGNRSLRLPVLAAQAFLRRHTLLARRRGVELKMEQLAELENRFGITEADIKQWLWMLSPSSGDVKLQRFFNSKCRKPLFLLQILLARDKKIHEPATFLGLIQYVRENYVLADRPPDELAHPAYKGQGKAVTWWHFIGWPAAMPLLARLTADYISTMRLDSRARAKTGYQARSLVLNKALRYLSWPARVRPLDHMEHNWAAQRHLLRLAATSEPPLVIDQHGYRAVREVLIALSKSKGEARNADRAAKTWPPYRRTVDGVDERRDLEDDLSRSAKAGLLAHAAGYNDDIVDRALNALAGSTFGSSPTIQTRSLAPHFFSGALASQNIYAEWAAQVRATRNAREAWMVFENPPEPGLRPDVKVYAQMFEKLYARPVTDSPVIRPGDALEVFPVHDGNLSEFEIARLTPPSPDELYDHMLLHDKLKPTGRCLAAALRYLSDSPFEPHIGALRLPVSNMTAESLKTLASIPLSVFNAWIALLCHLHTRVPRQADISSERLDEPRDEAASGDKANNELEQEHPSRQLSQGGSIQEAIELAAAFQRHNPRAAHHDRTPWLTIMRALAGRKLLHSRLGAEFNVLETLITFLRIFETTTESKGVDPVSFEALCVMIRKALKLTTFQVLEGLGMTVRPHISSTQVLERYLLKAHRYMTKTFEAITAPIPEFIEDIEPAASTGSGLEGENDAVEEADSADGVSPEMLRYNVVGRPLHKYMMALACCGDDREMVRVMDWLLDGWDREYIREEAKASYHIDYHYTMRTIAYFARMGKELVHPAEMERLARRLADMRWQKGCTWFWPREDWQGDGPDLLPELETDLPARPSSPTRSVSPSIASLSGDARDFEVGRSGRICVELPKSTLVHPRSQYEGFVPPLPPCKEREALASLMKAVHAQGGQEKEEFVEFELDQFCFYNLSHSCPLEMRPLQHMATKRRHSQFYFDGVLSLGPVKHYVENVEVSGLPIGNYGTSHPTVKGQIWIRSRLNSKREVYYLLKKPRVEYARFYTPFLWTADLAKHVVDYSASMIQQRRQVEIHSFKAHFAQWLVNTHGRSAVFWNWRGKHPSNDYRTSPCFLPRDVIERIKPGDTISTSRDGAATGTKWRNMAAKGAVQDDRWFGLVQKVHVSKKGARSFDVTWFYRPVDTPCCMMKYPWPNELFLSDHCNCAESREARIKEHQVLAIHDVDWFGSPDSGKGEFFVRQTYIESHMAFCHGRQRLGFKTGDTVLATTGSRSTTAGSQHSTGVYEVVKIFRQGETSFVRLRCLLPRNQIDPGAEAPANELVYTDRLLIVKPDRVIGKCLVRFFRAGERMPTPYDRGGTGNLFYITHLETQDEGASKCVPLVSEFPASLRQGFDPTGQTFRKLRGMDLFCGSGNFGRGLEEGGAVEMRWVNDIWDRAIHTYIANTPDPKTTTPFLGSVDDLLRLALEGKYSDNVPRPGEVEFISAGSPCPALSQIKNQSLVASFASFVDFYRPHYGILENVSAIVQSHRNRSEDVLSQLFCAIVGMGYQAQLVLGDAWSHGAPQSRNRVFLYFAAPGQQLPEAPLLSHSHIPNVTNRGLGELCNGEAFVSRSFQPTPFRYVSAGQATADLPSIDDGKAEPSAAALPAHRVSVNVSPALRAQIAAIPTRPRGMNFATAWRQGGGGGGVMSRADRALFPEGGKRVLSAASLGWGRVDPRGVFRTVTTCCQPRDMMTGTIWHWDENRPLTVQEVRRAQGFPDDEVLLGSLADQWKLVGNSVARQMALALGLNVGGGGGGGGGATTREGSQAANGVVMAGDGVRAAAVAAPATNGQVVNGRLAEVIDLTSESEAEDIQHHDTARDDFVDLTSPLRRHRLRRAETKGARRLWAFQSRPGLG